MALLDYDRPRRRGDGEAVPPLANPIGSETPPPQNFTPQTATPQPPPNWGFSANQPPQQPQPQPDQLTAILQKYGHSPIDLSQWQQDIAGGKTTIQNFEREVQNTMNQPNAARYNWGQPAAGAPAGGAAAPRMWDEGSFVAQFGRPGTVQELLALEQQLAQHGIKVARNAQGVAGKIILPNGQYVDIINSAGLGGRGFQWLTDAGGSEQTGQFFRDPIGSWFSGMVGDIIKQLQGQPLAQGELNELMAQLRTQLGGPNGSGGLGFDEFSNLVNQRVGELYQEPFSQGEEAAQRVRAFDNLERSKQAARQDVIRRMAAAGHGRGSGTIEEALQQSDAAFTQARAQNENELLLNTTAERQRRRDQAVNIRQALAQLGTGRLQGKMQGQQLLAQIIQQMQGSRDQRLMAILQAAGLIPQLESERFRRAQGSLT